MTLLHPARPGSRISVFFVQGAPVRLVSGTARFGVVDEPKCADINGTRYWRVRAVSSSGQHGTFDLREAADGWILEGVEEDAESAGSSR
jgi:hypothetical protein